MFVDSMTFLLPGTGGVKARRMSSQGMRECRTKTSRLCLSLQSANSLLTLEISSSPGRKTRTEPQTLEEVQNGASTHNQKLLHLPVWTISIDLV